MDSFPSDEELNARFEALRVKQSPIIAFAEIASVVKTLPAGRLPRNDASNKECLINYLILFSYTLYNSFNFLYFKNVDFAEILQTTKP